jgi:hypothetical protein
MGRTNKARSKRMKKLNDNVLAQAKAAAYAVTVIRQSRRKRFVVKPTKCGMRLGNCKGRYTLSP